MSLTNKLTAIAIALAGAVASAPTLAQQYPTYTHFVTNPLDNSVTGFTTTGMGNKLSQGDPTLRDINVRDKNADVADREAQIDERKAQGKYYDARTDYTKKKDPNATRNGVEPGLTQNEFLRQYNAFRTSPPWSPWAPAPDNADTLSKFKQSISDKGLSVKGVRSGLIAPPEMGPGRGASMGGTNPFLSNDDDESDE